MVEQIIYYFDSIPTIGFCPKCEVTAIYMDGLVCPKCRNRELSIFIWDGESKHPVEQT
ncbi:unnamed protein product [marine sediment metagenome]|uniref:Uncharacterized protein n=1 Tax=marine sediment metagenome TaxID=412755 RepID=X1G2H9_9ZZZZ